MFLQEEEAQTKYTSSSNTVVIDDNQGEEMDLTQKLAKNQENYRQRLIELQGGGGQAIQKNNFKRSSHYNVHDQYYGDIDFGNLQSFNTSNNQGPPQSLESNVVMVPFNDGNNLIGDSDQEEDLTEEKLKFQKDQVLSEDSDEEYEKKKHDQHKDEEKVPENSKIQAEILKQQEQKLLELEQQQKLQQQEKQQQEKEENVSPTKISAKDRTAARQKKRERKGKKTDQKDEITSKKDLDQKEEEEESKQSEQESNRSNEQQQLIQKQNEEEKTQLTQPDQRLYRRRKYIPIAKPNPEFQIQNMREFLTRPLPRGYLLQVKIKRDRQGMGKFYPKYHMYNSHGFRYMMSCKKRTGNKTSNYIIGMDKQNLDRKSVGFLGKVRSNFMGTEFHVYDTGENPENTQSIDKVRSELACVLYDNKLQGEKGPTRKMRIMIPQVDDETEEPVNNKPVFEQDSLLGRYKQGSLKEMHYYHNKPPKWNSQIKAFVLNFNGRVDKPSVKNFQLIDYINEDLVYLQFGRVGEEEFHMDAQYPMSPLQAFGICISSFDYKFACE